MNNHWYVKSKNSGGIRVSWTEDGQPKSLWFPTKEEADEWIYTNMGGDKTQPSVTPEIRRP
jgi:hypothetical protein